MQENSKIIYREEKHEKTKPAKKNQISTHDCEKKTYRLPENYLKKLIRKYIQI